jgi:hypothetical protein
MTRHVMGKLHRPETGQMLVLGAGFFAILLVLLGVALYFGTHMSQRRSLQNVADAAAMAGAQELNGTATSEALAIAKAQEYIDANVSDLDGAPVITVGDGFTSIKVTVRRTPNGALPVFGLGDEQIGASAKAIVASPLLPGPGVVPLAIDRATWEECEDNGGCSDVTLKDDAASGAEPPSNYQLMAIDPEGAQDVCNGLIGGSEAPIDDPEWNKTGNVSSLHSCLVDRLEAADDNNCLTLDEVLDGNGLLREECNPLAKAGKGAHPDHPNAQPTSVILIPVLEEFLQGKSEHDIVGDGEEPRIFAFFWVNPDTVYGSSPTCEPPNGQGGGRAANAADVWPSDQAQGPIVLGDHKPTHNPPGQNTPTPTPTPGGPTPTPTQPGNGGGGGGNGQCYIYGNFIQSYPAVLRPNDGGTTTFDPDNPLKVVTLIE